MAREKAKGVSLDKKQAQAAIRLLDEEGLRKKELKPKREKEQVVVPCQNIKAAENLLKKKKLKFKILSKLFEKQPAKVKSLKEALAEKLSKDREAARVYLPAPRVGEIHRQPDLARTFRLVAEGGADAFYRGPLAQRIAACVQAKGGYLTTDDLAAHTATWETPIRTTYRDVEMLEHPPNGQGLAALVALRVNHHAHVQVVQDRNRHKDGKQVLY